MHFNFKNITKHKLATIIGLALIGAGIYVFVIHAERGIESTALIVLGMGGVFGKNNPFK